MYRITRRQFVTTLGTLAATSITSAALPRYGHSALKGTRLHLLRNSSYSPAENAWFKETLKKQWAEPNGVDLVVELVSENDLQAKVSVAIESGSGPDILGLIHNLAHLYSPKLRDVSAIAEKQEVDGEGHWEICKANCKVGGVWKAIPMNIGANAIHYRTDLLKEVGERKFPNNLDDYNRVGKLLKQKGTPTGQAVGHTIGDPPSWFYSLLWMFGGAEVDETGKKVAINTKETLAAVEFAAQWYRDSLTPDMLGWDDASNNKAYLAGLIWATSNSPSILLTAKKDFPDIAANTDLTNYPKGPKGLFQYGTVYSHAIPTYVKDPKPAEELLRWIADPKNYNAWLDIGSSAFAAPVRAYSRHPIWTKDPRMAVFKDLSMYRWPGAPGPASPAASEVLSKFIIIDMFAKAMQGTKPQEAVIWAERQLKGIYDKA